VKPLTFVVATALLAASVVQAEDQPAPNAKPVLVDPADLRPPVPDPEGELSGKYNGKLVRFQGLVATWGEETRKGGYWYDIQANVAAASGEKGPVVVKVYFQGDEAWLRTRQSKITVTVEGTGVVSVDGSLVIRDAKIVSHKVVPAR
jgi:hypothetical protein